MKRLSRIPLTPSMIQRKQELLGEIKDNTIPDCVYNEIIAGEYDDWKPNMVENVDLPSYLKSYQIKDLQKALGQSCVFNINKPGYGKTLETIMWIKTILKKDFKVLVLCPKSVIETWHNQLRRFWPEYLNCGTWWVTNYEQLYNKERFSIAKEFEWDLIVLDESHTIKSMRSKVTQTVFQLKSKSRHCLTGTPIKNRPQDLAAQLKWLDPFSITSFTDFQAAFCELERTHWGPIPRGLTKDKKMVNNLQKLLDIYCVGGQEHNIGLEDQPEYLKVRLTMDPKVKVLYDKVVGEYDSELKQRIIDTETLLDEGIKVSSAIESAVRRQQLASNPQLFNPELKNVKFEWILDWLKGTDEKVVIFSKFAKTIDALEKYLLSNKIELSRVKREQKPAERQKAINTWNTSKQAILGTFGVLAYGVDELQNICRYVIFVDREWTASDNEQAERRVYRTGQTRPPIIYILQCKGTIDVRIEKVQLDKGHDAKELLDPVTEEEE